MTIDVGTGDGRAVLAAAARYPFALALGLDANAAAMAETSRRAAGPIRKGGLPNAAFLLVRAEVPPAELCGLASRVTVQFPWGSLLRGCTGGDPLVAAGVARLVARSGSLDLLLAPSARDGLDGLPLGPNAVEAAIAGTFEPLGFSLSEARPALAEEVRASGSTWAKRLGSQRPSDRPVMLVRLVRPT